MELKYSVAPKNDRCFVNDGLLQVETLAQNETGTPGEKFAEIRLEFGEETGKNSSPVAQPIDDWISVQEPMDPEVIRENSAFALQVQIQLRNNGTAIPSPLMQIRYKIKFKLRFIERIRGRSKV